MCPTVFVYLVSVQEKLLRTEPALVPGHGVQLLPVVAELLHVLLDGDVMAGPGVAPHAGQADQSVAHPALVGAAVSHVVTEHLLLPQSLLLQFRHLPAWRLFSLGNLSPYFWEFRKYLRNHRCTKSQLKLEGN